MTTTPRILRNCALALPLVVLGAGVAAGPRVAAEVAIGGAFGTMNLLMLAWIGSGFVREAAVGGSGLYGGLMVTKMAVVIPAFLLLLEWIAPQNAVAGLCAVFVGVTITGIELAFVDPGPELELELPDTAPDPRAHGPRATLLAVDGAAPAAPGDLVES